ncbi:hypothetical protein E4U21_002564 [Claviceps maximensis]|nr:hypothetical protein E4U21_002564 [Claviceps maximensis]
MSEVGTLDSGLGNAQCAVCMVHCSGHNKTERASREDARSPPTWEQTEQTGANRATIVWDPGDDLETGHDDDSTLILHDPLRNPSIAVDL